MFKFKYIKLILIPFFLIFFFNFLHSEKKDFGLGVIIGEPTGISFKKWLTNKTAVDGGIAWSFTEKSSMHIHMDYLIHNYSLIKVKKGEANLSYGIGFRLKAQRKSKIGARIPVGISYKFEKIPIDIFIEFGPIFDLIPSTEFNITAGIGSRYYF